MDSGLRKSGRRRALAIAVGSLALAAASALPATSQTDWVSLGLNFDFHELAGVVADPVNPNVAYAALLVFDAPCGVARSEDWGLFWRPACNGLPEGTEVVQLVFAPSGSLFCARPVGAAAGSAQLLEGRPLGIEGRREELYARGPPAIPPDLLPRLLGPTPPRAGVRCGRSRQLLLGGRGWTLPDPRSRRGLGALGGLAPLLRRAVGRRRPCESASDLPRPPVRPPGRRPRSSSARRSTGRSSGSSASWPPSEAFECSGRMDPAHLDPASMPQDRTAPGDAQCLLVARRDDDEEAARPILQIHR